MNGGAANFLPQIAAEKAVVGGFNSLPGHHGPAVFVELLAYFSAHRDMADY